MTLTASPGAVRGPGSTRSLVRTGAIGITVIWVSVLFISVFAPDSVTGSEQQHVPIAAILTWIWGLMASRSVATALAAHREHPDRLPQVRMLVTGIAAVWVIAGAVAVFGPVTVTGADPTKMPVWAILAPIAALVITTTACQLFSTLHGRD